MRTRGPASAPWSDWAGLPRAAASALAAEQDRWFLWLPVLFGTGIGIYFALPSEPWLPAALAPAAAALAIWVVWRHGGAALLVGSALLAVALGLAAAKVRSDLVAAPVIERQLGPVGVAGWVELVEPRSDGSERLTLRVAAIDGLAAEVLPRRVRLRVIGAAATPSAPGDAVRLQATLSPPPPPALPGGFDFARSAWFQGLGGVGFARDAPMPVVLAARPWDLAWRSAIERVRQAIGARIRTALPGETGGIAVALITGERGGITERTNDAFRDSGLFHILSISGLHMVIMAGSVFLAVRFLLSLVPMLALAYPIKKWAATAAAAGALAYLTISGASFPTVRSWIMISIMYLAVLLDRPAVALRNVALAALVILVVWPESMIDVGFQMSFAAVVSLVAAYEWIRDRRPLADMPRGGILWQGLLLLGGIVVSTLIASLAVAPIGAYHFHKTQQYAIIANLIAIPICNLLVMPAALATLVAMPLGLERWPLAAMGIGIEGMVWTAYAVAALPGAVGRIAAFPGSALLVMVAGGLWLALWRRPWRLLGLIPAVAGALLIFWREPPDVLVGRGGRLIAVRGTDGLLEARGEQADRFDLARWLEHDGDGRTAEEVRRPKAFRCDWSGCVIPLPGRQNRVASPSAGTDDQLRPSTSRASPRHLALSRHPAALADDCQRAAIVIVAGRPHRSCQPNATGNPASANATLEQRTETTVSPSPNPKPDEAGSTDAPAATVSPDAMPPSDPASSNPTKSPPAARASSEPTRSDGNAPAIRSRSQRAAPLVIAEPELGRGIAWAIRIAPDGTIQARSVASERGDRPWSRAATGATGLRAPPAYGDKRGAASGEQTIAPASTAEPEAVAPPSDAKRRRPTDNSRPPALAPARPERTYSRGDPAAGGAAPPPTHDDDY